MAEKLKRDKYAELATSNDFVPIAVETMGAWGADALALTAELGGRIAALTGEPRSTSCVSALTLRYKGAMRQRFAEHYRGRIT